MACVTSGWNCKRESRSGADRLHFERIALGQQFGAGRQIEPFAVPLIDAFGPGLDDGEAGRRRPDRIIADLGVALGMAKHFAAELPREHLGAEADAEKRLVLLKRHADPIDLAPDVIVLVIGAHRAAENDGAGMFRHGRRQGIVEARAAHIEPVAKVAQRIADAAGGGMFLVQDDQDRLLHDAGDSFAFLKF